MKHLTIIFVSIFASALAWSQTPLPLAWVPGGSNNLEANLDVGPTVTLSPTTTVMAAGYYAATNLAEVEPDLAAGNIAANVTVFGVAGTLSTTPAPVPKTGQTNMYQIADDGMNQIGVAWPKPRFSPVAADGAETNQIRDNLTGLIWARNANIAGGVMPWSNAVEYCSTNLNVVGGQYHDYGGTNDWRLPNIRELHSLIAWQYYNPVLSDGTGTNQWTEARGPFTGVKSGYYWSGTTLMGDPSYAWYVLLTSGNVRYANKSDTYYVWPVRGP